MHDGNHHGIDADSIALLVIFHGDLSLTVGTEQVIGMDALGQPVGKSTAQGNRQRHQLGGLGAGTAKHHTLVTGSANLIVGTQRDIRGLGVNTALDLNRLGIKAIAGIDIADLADGFSCHSFVVHHSLGGDLAADDAEVSGHPGLAGNTGTGILSEAGIQDGIGNGVGNLVRMAVGHTFGSKQSFFHIDSFHIFLLST